MSAQHQTAVEDVVLRVEQLSKQFPQVVANDGISFDVRRGEIHCLLGENGAGKSTLAEIIYGVLRPDSGEIRIGGKPVALASPRDAINNGIGMVHQHFVLIPPMSVVENVVIGTPQPGIWLNLEHATSRLEDLCRDYGVALDLRAPVVHLSVGQQQWVEILKALYSGVQLLILDEPTAVLTPQEVEKFFAILRKMRSDGLSILFITHKLQEVMAISDRVTVLRKGRLVGTVSTASVTKQELARMMVGREVLLELGVSECEAGSVLLDVQALHLRGDRGQVILDGVSFRLHRHEILGLAGVSGNGQAELFDVLAGMRKVSGGRILLEGRDITNHPPSSLAVYGVGNVPEDRIRQGLVMDFRVDENLILGFHSSPPFTRNSFLQQPAIDQFAEKLIQQFDIATQSARQLSKTLSGGNLQKVILARELSQRPRCLVVSQPTRGLDVGATEYVHQRLLEERDRGTGILLISEDLDEIFTLASRIAIMFRGRILDILPAREATIETVGLLMAGAHERVL